jgi:hypothetical protein
MLQSILRIMQSISFVVLLCAGAIVHAQDDITSRGIETFRETCLMADARSEKIYQWAADKDLKIVQGQGPERAGPKVLTWEVARSGVATVLLQAIINNPGHLNCTVNFDQQRDSNKLVEAFFLEEMKRHPNAKQLNPGSGRDRTAYTFIDGKDLYVYFDGRQSEQDRPHILLAVAATVSPPDVALPRPFATPERSYRFFVNACLARFPDIESIGEYVKASGWKSPTALRTSPFYSGIWDLWDPFDEMSPYGVELRRSNAFKSCTFAFDLRAAVPMERLIRSYALVHADAPYPTQPRQPDEKIEYYSGLVGGTKALFELRMEEATHEGELGVFVETPQ